MLVAARAEEPGEALDAARARLFGLVGRLLLAPPDAALLARLAALPPGDGTELGEAMARLGETARAATSAAVEREFHDLFVGLGRGEVLPYASYYLTGFLHERPLARVREALARLGVARAPGVVEPEDHLGFLCETYAGLLDGALAAPDEAPGFWRDHLAPWAGRAFADVEAAASARFYGPLGALGRAAAGIEAAAWELPA